jgi:hypothetical protein
MRRALALAFVVTALTACGSPAPTGAKVATLTSPKAGASSAAEPQRPRERLDMTPDEIGALMVPYQKCLKSHGVSDLDAKKGYDAAHSGGADVNEWQRYCEAHYFPLPAWEKDPANPEARDFALAVVKCLRGKGVDNVEVSADGVSIAAGGDDNDSRSIAEVMDLQPECEREVVAQKK